MVLINIAGDPRQNFSSWNGHVNRKWYISARDTPNWQLVDLKKWSFI